MIFAWPELAAMHARVTATARAELVRLLNILQDGTDWTVAVVFDGKGVRPSNESDPGGVKVFYSKSGQTADSIIERLAAKYAPDCDVTVATNDRMERQTAESFGSLSISSDQLLSEIHAAGNAIRTEIDRLKRRR